MGTKLPENALLVVTIPDEYTEKDKEIMKKCLFDANLIQNEISQNLQFVTECRYKIQNFSLIMKLNYLLFVYLYLQLRLRQFIV